MTRTKKMAKPNLRNEKVTLATHRKYEPYKLRMNRDFADKNESLEMFRSVSAELKKKYIKCPAHFTREKNEYRELRKKEIDRLIKKQLRLPKRGILEYNIQDQVVLMFREQEIKIKYTKSSERSELRTRTFVMGITVCRF